MPTTTAPLANRAILPVSNVIRRDPISNSSLKDSRTLVPATGGHESEDANPSLPLQMVRNPRARHVRKCGKDTRRGFALALLAIADIERANEGGRETMMRG